MDFKNMMLKNKRVLVSLTIALAVGIMGGMSNMPVDEYNEKVSQKQELDNQLVLVEQKVDESKKEVEVLQAQKDERDRLAKIEAERIAAEAKAKAEAEKKAKEEADRLAKEEAARIAKAEANRVAAQAEADRIAQANASQNNVGSSNNTNPVGDMVWLSATGEKYHRINNCGRMNPSTARQVTASSAKSSGYGACSKCY